VKKQTRSKRGVRGYSIVELLVSLGIISVFSAFAVPSLVRTYRNYQMDDIANQVASELKFTRYEAIRRNFNMPCVDSPQAARGGRLTMFTDYNGSGTVQVSEKQVVFSGPATLVDSATVPASGSLAAAANSGALTTISPTNGSLSFDGRGAKIGAGASVYWVGNVNYGWRAVIVFPSGSIQVWSNVTGGWTLLS
jgi:prepilin-type N-terminal cleavage/methylation domain-containing protein